VNFEISLTASYQFHLAVTMDSQEDPVPVVQVAANANGDSSSRSDEPAAKRVKLDPVSVSAIEAVKTEPRVKVKGYALIKEEYVMCRVFCSPG
jgi:tRNA-dihydrouridine synthase 3